MKIYTLNEQLQDFPDRYARLYAHTPGLIDNQLDVLYKEVINIIQSNSSLKTKVEQLKKVKGMPKPWLEFECDSCEKESEILVGLPYHDSEYGTIELKVCKACISNAIKAFDDFDK